MAGSRQTFRYRDPRETRLLNQASKDQYGRQRNHVLYGFEWEANPSNRNQIILGRGAIYTQDGVKIFFDDEQSFIIPVIDPLIGLTGGTAGIDDFPYPKTIIVGIEHNFTPSISSKEAKIVLIEVRDSQKDQEPAYYIKEINTITLTPLDSELIDADRLAYNGLYDTKPSGVITTVAKIASQKLSNSIPNNITPILKVRIQQLHINPGVSIPPYLFTAGGLLEDGVIITRYKNVWNQVNDLLGVNVFEPLIEDDQNALHDLNYPSNNRSAQGFVKNSAVTLPLVEQHTPTQHPLFGSFDSNITHNYAGYRFSNFLMDGKSIIEGMKRLDSWMRLLVNRTGEQSLVDLVNSLDELDDIVDQGTTGDPIVYGTNFMLKSGTIHHVDPGNGATYGDTHRRALHFLDNCVKFISTRLGLTPMMTRVEIEADNFSVPELWTVTNPPGLDIAANMDYHTAIQTLRNYFTSRGNDVITGRHIYSLTDSDRDQSAGAPAGQKVITDNSKVEVTNDIIYLKIENGSIDSSSPRSEKIGGVEVASLDSLSRYKVDKLSSHDAARITAIQGPLIEGAINAPQGDSFPGLMHNLVNYNPRWALDQLRDWAGNTSVSHGPNGGLSLPGPNEIKLGTFLPCKGFSLEWAYDLNNLVLTGGGTLLIRLRFFDASFVEIAGREITIASKTVSGSYIGNGTIIDGATVGTHKPVTAVFFKVCVNYSSGTATFSLRYGCNVSNGPVLSNTPTIGGDPRTLTRKDYVDSIVLTTGTGLLTASQADYPGDANYEGNVKVSPGTFGNEYRIPALQKTSATPHSPGSIGAALRILASDGQYWFVPGIPSAQGASCFCQCECQCQCQCQCEGNCSCNGQCSCKGGMNCAGGW